MSEKKSITRETSSRYQKSFKKEKGVILDEFTALTGYNRCYASYILRNWGKKLFIKLGGRQIVVIAGERRKKFKRKIPRIYDDEILSLLKMLWYISDCLCGKRLSVFIRETLPVLVKHGEVKVDRKTRDKLMKISPATIDRLLAHEKSNLQFKSKSRTKPGTLLKHQIPVRTFSDWDEDKPGFVEVDLVGHEGGNSSGDFIQSLDVTDVCTGWTEIQAVKNKAQVWVFEALKKIEERMPFKLKGIDSDNGSEFINEHLLRYCKKNEITFTRARANRKNDNCYVEQKNYTVVRRNVGYARYDTDKELKMLNELYAYLRLYTNFFQPSMKLVEKNRIGSKVKKRYDKPMTPYKRLLKSLNSDKAAQAKLKEQYDNLNPAHLKREISKLQNKLLKTNSKKRGRVYQHKDNFIYNSNEATNNSFV